MAYKARRSGRMSTPMIQQAYYSTHGYNQTYGMSSEGYDQSYEGGYSYDPNQAYGNTVEEEIVFPKLSIVLRPQYSTGKGKVLSPPLVVSAVDYDPNRRYMISAAAYDQSDKELAFNRYNSDDYYLDGQTSSDAYEVPTEDGTKLFAGLGNLHIGTAEILTIKVSMGVYEANGGTMTVAQTQFKMQCHVEAMSKVAMTFPDSKQGEFLKLIGVPYLEKDDKQKDGYKWAE